MNKHLNKLINLVLAIILIGCFSSCVGTIKSADPVSTIVAKTSNSVLNNFAGLSLANPISNTKVELFFQPVGTDIDKYSYIVSFDRQQIPVYISANSLKMDYRGLVKYTVTGLDANTKYTFSVQLRDITSQVESTNNIKISATTFANTTANFYGISDVRNLSGSAGLNGIEVIWPEAEVKGTDVFKNEIDPIEYKITIIDASFLTPGNMNDSAFTEPNRKVISAAGTQRNLIINGLKAGTKYYVQTRTIHHGFTANSANSNYKVEENSNYMELSTYTDDLASLSFNNSSFFLAWPVGSGGLFALNGNWTAPTGNFDHYRMYYAKTGTVNLNSFLNTQDVDGLCFDSEVNNSNVFCQDADSDKTTAAITGLTPNTQYDVILAVCLTTNCERAKRVISSTQTKTTTPNAANFQGITTILTSNDINNLNTLQLNFQQPDFSSGNISGFLVDYFGNNPNNTTPVTLNDTSVINTTSINVDNFDFMTASFITLNGIDYSSTDQQCFLVYPFTYTNLSTKLASKAGLQPVCITPTLRGPTAVEFPGFSSGNDLCEKSFKKVVLNWDAPLKGIYDKYEIFYIKSDVDAFSFATGVNWESNPTYHRILIDSSQTSYTLTNMATGIGAVYKIGILSYYDSPAGPVRSEFNLKTITCDFR